MHDDGVLTEDEWALLDDVDDDWYGLWEVDWWFNGVHPDWPFPARLALFSGLVRRGFIDIFFGQLGKDSSPLQVEVALKAISLPDAWLPRTDLSDAVYQASTSDIGRAKLVEHQIGPSSKKE